MRRAVLAAEEAGVERVADGQRPRSVLVAALGGSAVVGDVLDLLAEAGLAGTPPTRREPPLPGWVGPLDLVIAVSQSGRAAGPLALAAEAARRGAALLTVGAADSPLAEVTARAHGVHVESPSPPRRRAPRCGRCSPRCSSPPTSSGSPTPRRRRSSRSPTCLDEVAEECRPSSESFVNPAKLLATGLDGTVPVVLGDGPLTGVAASRAAAMLTRTARVPALHGSLPDAAVPGRRHARRPLRQRRLRLGPRRAARDLFADPYLDGPPMPRLGLLALRDPDLDPADIALADAVLESARESGAVVLEQQARSGHPVERLASLMSVTDFAATYLALGLGLDPAVSRHVLDLRDRTS